MQYINSRLKHQSLSKVQSCFSVKLIAESANSIIVGCMSLERRIKIQVKGKTHQFFAVYPPGFEDIGVAELKNAGITQIDNIETGGILFTAKIQQMMQAVISCRGAVRILMRLASFNASNFSMLMRRLKNEIAWELYLPPKCIPDFSVSAVKSRLYHSDAVAEHARKAFVSMVGNDATPQEQTVYIRIVNDKCTISLDCCKESLQRRGYKIYTADAPLRENLASLLIERIATQFPEKRYDAVYDPMCGSGTFLTEAALQNGKLQSKLASLRTFAFQQWPVYSEAAFNFIVHKQPPAFSHIFSDNLQIFGSDINNGNIRLTSENTANLGLTIINNFSEMLDEPAIHLMTADFFKTTKKSIPFKEKMLLIFNPPYGKRLKIDKKTFFTQIGSHLKLHYKNCDALVIVPDEEAEKAMKLYYEKKWIFKNGGLPVAALFFRL